MRLLWEWELILKRMVSLVNKVEAFAESPFQTGFREFLQALEFVYYILSPAAREGFPGLFIYLENFMEV